MVRFGVPGQNVDTLAYADGRLSTVPMVQAPRRPTVTDKKFPMWCEWRTDKNVTAPVTEGEWWKLIRFESNGDATWVRVDIGGGLPGVDDIRDQVDVQVTPDVSGNIDIDGAVVNAGANPSGIPLETVADPGTNTLDVQIQVAAARTGAPGDKNDAGICSFDDTVFAVDGDGYVTLASGPGPVLDTIDIDFNTAPGTDPVVPDANGQVAIFGNTVTNATNANAPVATHSRAANQFHVDVQLATTVDPAPADPFDAGLASYNSKQFEVDSNGWVSLNSSHANSPGFSNLGFQYDGGTGVFTIRGADADLSSDNYATVTLRSVLDDDHLVTIKVEANQSFIDDVGASEIIGNVFGLTSGAASPQVHLFTVYAVLNDAEDTIQFMISRLPNEFKSPAVANIGAPDDAVANIATAFWSLDNIDETLYDENPCLPVGSITMSMSSSDDWTISGWFPSGGGGNDLGIGNFGDGKAYVLSLGQFGAAAGKYFQDNGGTAPGFNGFNYNYYVDTNRQMVQVEFDSGANNVAGVGAFTARLVLPYIIGPNASTAHAYWTGGAVFFDNSAGTYNLLSVTIPNNTNYAQFRLDGSTVLLQNADFDANDRIYGAFQYNFTNSQ